MKISTNGSLETRPLPAATGADGLSTEDPEVWCVVLNWNGWRDTLQCLDALAKCSYARLTAIVVDNGSTNDSVSRIRTEYPDLLVLETGSNLGFAGGNNVGIRFALERGADYIWLLNNDTIAAPEALSRLLEKALTDSRIGAVASICYYADDPEKIEAWGGARVNLWIGFGRNSTRPRDDDWFHSLNGTSLLITREALQDAGLFDEGFFLYWEDTEFCMRLRKRGWRIAAAPGSRVLHKVHGSSGWEKLMLDRHQTTSGLRLLGLHSSFPRLSMLLFLTMRFTKRIVRFEFARCASVWAGVREYRERLPVVPNIR